MVEAMPLSFVDRLILGLLFVGLVVLLFHVYPDYGPIAQGAGIALVVASGALAVFAGFSKTRLSSIELCVFLMAALSLLSNFLGVGEVNSETWTTSVIFAALLPLLTLTNGALIRRYGLQPILTCSAWALATSALIVLAVEYQDLALGLTSDVNERWRSRLTPLGMHPNIAGIVFALAIVLSLYQVAFGTGRSRLFFGLVTPLHFAIIAATGSRGGIVACVLSVGLLVLFKFRSLPPKVRSPVILSGAALAALVAYYWHAIYGLMAQVFELESASRGWGSGATGRVEAWSDGLAYIFSDASRMAIGAGLRTASIEVIGFPTESSYITVIIESGIPLAVVFFGALLLTLLRLYAQAPRDATHVMTNLGALAVIQFAMVESFFNRYLLAIGNPASVIFLLIFVGGWLNTRYQVGTPPVRDLGQARSDQSRRVLQS